MSAIGRLKMESLDHVSVAPVAAPFSSTRVSPLPVIPAAEFQVDLGTTPAVSDAAMGAADFPTKSMLIAVAPDEALVTTRFVVAVCDKLLLVPVIVRVEVATGVVLLVVTVIVEEPLVVMVVGENVPEAPVGRPLTLRVTVPAKLFNGDMVTV